MTGSLLKLREILNELNPSERKIADYMLNNLDEIVGLSIREIAGKSGASEAAVVRLCKRLKFNGYKDFKIALTSDIASLRSEEIKYTDIKPGDSIETIIENVCHNNKKSIEDTLQILNYDEVKKAVYVIHRAHRIDFYGVGASGIIALDGQQKFVRIGKFVQAFTDPHMQVTAAATLTNKDVAVLISYTGETRDIIETANAVRASGATMISITKFGQSTLSEMSHINLFLSSPETSMRSGAMGSRIAQLNMIDIIFSCVASIEYNNIKKYLDDTHKYTSLKKFK